MFAEIRDEYGDVESATLCDTVAEVNRFYIDHGVEFSKVEFINGKYTYTNQR